MDSVTLYVTKSVIPAKTLVFAVVPSSVNEKLVNGVGEAVKPNCRSLSTDACFTMVRDAA
jgi:hypothetical protein